MIKTVVKPGWSYLEASLEEREFSLQDTDACEECGIETMNKLFYHEYLETHFACSVKCAKEIAYTALEKFMAGIDNE